MGASVRSTRGGGAASATSAILTGLAPDGGLFVPAGFPFVKLSEISLMADESYARRAARILAKVLPAFEQDELADAIGRAYSRFTDAAVAPLRPLSDNRYILELHHGPTLAFKDFALQLLPSLMGMSARIEGGGGKKLILVATSGDTGKAALEAFADQPDAEIIVFYPVDGVSEAQRLQMVTQRGANVHVAAVRGNFDDAQTGVKKLFASPDFQSLIRQRGFTLSSANSINYGRLIPQIVYYFSAYADLLKAGKVKLGGLVNFCVPTGNFGNILAADCARRMGLPIGKLICASNRNNILADFIRTGVYDTRREFHVTSSPAMDILVSSNLERFLFEITGRDAARLSSLMNDLKAQGWFSINHVEHAAVKARMLAGWADEDSARQAIARVWNESRTLIDPHTAIGADVLTRVSLPGDEPAVLVSTASPFKFGRDVAKAIAPYISDDASDFDCCAAISKVTGLPVPPSIAELPGLPVRHKALCEPDQMGAIVKEFLA